MKATRINYENDSKYQAKADPRDRRAVLSELAAVPDSILALGPEMVRYWRSKSVKLHDADQSETPDDIRRWALGEIPAWSPSQDRRLQGNHPLHGRPKSWSVCEPSKRIHKYFQWLCRGFAKPSD